MDFDAKIVKIKATDSYLTILDFLGNLYISNNNEIYFELYSIFKKKRVVDFDSGEGFSIILSFDRNETIIPYDYPIKIFKQLEFNTIRNKVDLIKQITKKKNELRNSEIDDALIFYDKLINDDNYLNFQDIEQKNENNKNLNIKIDKNIIIKKKKDMIQCSKFILDSIDKEKNKNLEKNKEFCHSSEKENLEYSDINKTTTRYSSIIDCILHKILIYNL